MLDKEKNRTIDEANFQQWEDGLRKAVKQIGDK